MADHHDTSTDLESKDLERPGSSDSFGMDNEDAAMLASLAVQSDSTSQQMTLEDENFSKAPLLLRPDSLSPKPSFVYSKPPSKPILRKASILRNRPSPRTDRDWSRQTGESRAELRDDMRKARQHDLSNLKLVPPELDSAPGGDVIKDDDCFIVENDQSTSSDTFDSQNLNGQSKSTFQMEGNDREHYGLMVKSSLLPPRTENQADATRTKQVDHGHPAAPSSVAQGDLIGSPYFKSLRTKFEDSKAPSAAVMHTPKEERSRYDNGPPKPTGKIDASDRGGDVGSLHRALHGRVTKNPRASIVQKPQTDAKLYERQRVKGSCPAGIDDYLQIVKYKYAQSQQDLTNQLRENQSAREQLEIKFQTVVVEREELSENLSKQDSKLEKYELKLAKMRKFMDGLGRDLDFLNSERNEIRRATEDLRTNGDDLNEERNAVILELRAGVDRFSSSRSEAIEACQAILADYERCKAQLTYVDKQLGEKTGLLAEERDRSASLERQLATTKSTNEGVMALCTSNFALVMEKLEMVELRGKTDDLRHDLVATMQNISDILRNVETTCHTTGSEVAILKEAFEALNKSCELIAQSGSTKTDNEEQAHSITQEYFNESLHMLRTELLRRDAILEEKIVSEQRTRSLEDQISSSRVHLTQTKAELAASRTLEEQLKNERDALKSEIARIGADDSLVDDLKMQLAVSEDQVTRQGDELTHIRGDLESKEQALAALTTRCRELEAIKNCLDAEVAALKSSNHLETEQDSDRAIQRRVEQVRRECAEHIRQFEKEVNSRVANEQKKYANNNQELQAKVQSLQLDLDKKTCENQKLHETLSITAHEVGSGRKQWIELDEAQKKKFAAQLEALKTGIDVEPDAERSQNFTQLQAALKTEKNLREQATRELESFSALMHSQIDALTHELNEAKTCAATAESGAEQLKASCQEAIEQEKNKSERQATALQKRLAEIQAEVYKARETHKSFRTKIGQSWQLEQQRFEEQKLMAARRVADVEAREAQLVKENDRLRTEVFSALGLCPTSSGDGSDLLEKFACTAEELLKSQLPSSSANSHIQVIQEPCSPTSQVLKTSPHVLAKTSASEDHTSLLSTLVQEGLAADALQVDDSQPNIDTLLKMPDAFLAGGNSSPSDLMVETDTSLVNEQQAIPAFDEQDVRSGLRHNEGPEIEDPTKPRLLGSSSSSLSDACSFDSVFDVLQSRIEGGQDIANTAKCLDSWSSSSHTNEQSAKQKSANLSPQTPLLKGSMHVESNNTVLPVDSEKYVFKKATPASNSASKLVHSSLRDRTSGQNRTSSAKRIDAPTVPESRKIESAGSVEELSSPDFLHPAPASFTRTYHAASAASAATRPSQVRSSTATVDPRLVFRNNPLAPKRVAEDDEDAGQAGHTRKRSTTEGSKGSPIQQRRFNLRSGPSGSLNDFSHLSNEKQYSKTTTSTSQTPESQPRMRTLAGSVSRGGRGIRRTTKSEMFNARFSQELASR